MGTNRRFAEAREKAAKENATKTGFWEEIKPRVSQGVVIPIISNSFRVEQIFRDDKVSTEEPTEKPQGDEANNKASTEEPAEKPQNDESNIFDQLTIEWATLVGYPMLDKDDLARVAQFFLVEQKDNPQARTKYLEFLKTILLTIAGVDANYADLAGKLKSQLQEQHFSDIAHQLDYPRFPQGVEDSLRTLAKLPLTTYVTTSYSDFMERALEAEGKKPRTQICFWSGVISSAKPEHRTDLEFIPTTTTPLVYHLFGLEDYPQTLVLSEDDYINFLIAVMQDTNTQNPIVPLSLRRALGESHLVFLGYKLSNLDFRVLFRYILKFRQDDFSPRGMLIQLQPDKKNIDDSEKSLDYLRRYFERKKFDIEWESAEKFIQRLWTEWDSYRRGKP